jgi:hypothetical protein
MGVLPFSKFNNHGESRKIQLVFTITVIPMRFEFFFGVVTGLSH